MHDIGATSYFFITFIGWYFIENSEASMPFKINQKSHSIILNKFNDIVHCSYINGFALIYMGVFLFNNIWVCSYIYGFAPIYMVLLLYIV